MVCMESDESTIHTAIWFHASFSCRPMNQGHSPWINPPRASCTRVCLLRSHLISSSPTNLPAFKYQKLLGSNRMQKPKNYNVRVPRWRVEHALLDILAARRSNVCIVHPQGFCPWGIHFWIISIDYVRRILRRSKVLFLLAVMFTRTSLMASWRST